MRDQEIILRFLALYYDADRYGKPMKAFLNTFMGRNKELKIHSRKDMQVVFSSTIRLIHDGIGQRAFRLGRVLNAAVLDAVMIGVARRLQQGPVADLKVLRARYLKPIGLLEFLAVTQQATADDHSVFLRLELATVAFADIP